MEYILKNEIADFYFASSCSVINAGYLVDVHNKNKETMN